MSDLFVYCRRPAGIAPSELAAALRERGIDAEWRATRLDQPDVLVGRLVPSGNSDAESQLSVAEEEIFDYQREELLDALPPDTPAERRNALEVVAARVRIAPLAGGEFDAVRAASITAMALARASDGLIKRQDEDRVYAPAEYAEIEPLARDLGDLPEAGS